MPWELQRFVCMKCSCVTTRETGPDRFEETPQAPAYNAVHAIAWMVEYGAHTAVVDDKVYRIVAYPSGSPLAGKYGCYCEGRYSGLTADLADAKAWCRALADDVDTSRRPVLHDRV